MPSCHYCGRADREVRPYGPGGATVCHPCATETPERQVAAEGAYGALLAAAGAVSPVNTVVIGRQSGPQPYVPRDEESR